MSKIKVKNTQTGEERTYDNVRYFKENRYLFYVTEAFPNFGTPPTDIYDKTVWTYEKITDEE